MVKIRLKRLGRKKKPFYRIVVTDNRNRRDGVPLEELGYYDPMLKDLKLDKTKALAWISKGAIPSDTVKRLIDKASETGELIRLERRQPKPKAQAPVAEEAAPVAVAAAVETAPVATEEEAPAAEEAAPAAE
jgi:small subunit ribosomal protein S16